MAALKYSPAQTILFDEEKGRFDTFIPCHPEMLCNIGTTLISFKDGVLYTHDTDTEYNTFFGVTSDSYVTAVFNKAENVVKTFKATELLASEKWDFPEIETSSNEYGTTKQQSNLIEADFNEFEGKYNAVFLGASNSIGGINNGSTLKGNFVTIKIRKQNPTHLVSLSSIAVSSIESKLNLK